MLAEAAALAPDLSQHADLTDLPFVTIDPEGSRDLDQAVHLSRDGSGFRVRYAIADVDSFVRLGGAIDAEARRRGQTLYLPVERVPLHPPSMSEGAASLLPDQDTPAVLRDLRLSASGEVTDRAASRAIVRSTAQLTYDGVQADLDAGTAGDQLRLLREVGRLREDRAAERGAVDLPSLEQRVETVDGVPVLTYRVPSPTERWNAQISLLTGGVAAQLMLDGKIGVLRTMPEIPGRRGGHAAPLGAGAGDRLAPGRGLRRGGLGARPVHPGARRRPPARHAAAPRCGLHLGEPVQVRLLTADPATRTVDFVLA